MLDQPRIFELHIQPNYAVYIPQRTTYGRKRTQRQLENEVNLSDNSRRAKMSYKATRRLKNAVNWLVASAENKTIFDKATNRHYSFKVNFVTLTLPTTQHNISDHHFKKVMLHNFINTCRYKFGLKNYIWKVETQANGNIHAHFTTDCFMHWRDLRDVWNRILSKNGLLEPYQKKHSQLSFSDYCKLYSRSGKRSIKQLRKAYDYGCSTGWWDPNTTDIHAVHKIKDIAAYLAKYMIKSEEDRRTVKGRLWGCSTSLSESNKLIVEICGHNDQDIIDSLFDNRIEYKQIYVQDKLTKAKRFIGEMFFFKLSDWGKVLKGRLLDYYNEHRFIIRNGLSFNGIFDIPPEVINLQTELIINRYRPPRYVQTSIV